MSIVIPVFNEASCLGTNAAIIEDYLTSMQIAYELILVNDGSTDSTETICRSIVDQNRSACLISYSINRGKGHAVKTGLLNANGRYRIFMDADLAVPVEFIGTCVQQLKKGSDIVIGSRHLAGSSLKVPEGALRRFMGGVYLTTVRAALGLRVTDITCGLKGFKKEAALDIFGRSKINRWGYDAELIFLAQKLGYSIREIPVDWYHSFNSKVNIGLDTFRTIIEMFKVYHCYHNGGYFLESE
jgi:glycosyltransferase involved in cell wall biosynthesis